MTRPADTQPPAATSAPGDDLVEVAALALKEAEARYVVEGTSDKPYGGPPYRLDGPWYLIDTKHAEPEVNWPGELVAEFTDGRLAHEERMRIVSRAVLAALNPAKENAGE